MSPTDLDQQLRAEGDRWRSEFPAADTFTESLAAARQTRPRRVWLVPLAAAAAVVTLVAGTVLIARSTHHSVPAASPVPWASATVPVPSPTARPVPRTSAYQACTDPGDFRLGQIDQAPALFNQFAHPVLLRMALQYEGKTPCYVGDYSILLQLLDESGRVLDTATELSTGVANPLPEPKYDVSQGTTVIVGATWVDTCTTSTAVRFRALIAGRAAFTSTLPGDSRPTCTAALTSEPHYLHAIVPEVAAPGSVEALVTTIHAPSTARYGQTLKFTVTITNLGAKPVPLEPCPAYAISLFTDPSHLGTQQLYQVGHTLNCAQAPAELKAGASRDWAMQIEVPVNTRPLDALGWQFVGDAAGVGVFRGSSIPITVS